MLYELLYLLPGDLTEGEINPITDEIKKRIADLNGKVETEEKIGKRKLSYPIQHNAYGSYLIIRFTLNQEDLIKLNKQLKLIPKLLRYLITKYSPPKIAKLKTATRRPILPSKEEPPSVKKPKVDLKKLSKKIDQLLTKI